jgi:hypothetical protein
MRWLCLFRQCRWLHVFNCMYPTMWEGEDPIAGEHFGVYQCKNCKTISIGSPRP